jgi:hypothetical protein
VKTLRTRTGMTSWTSVQHVRALPVHCLLHLHAAWLTARDPAALQMTSVSGPLFPASAQPLPAQPCRCISLSHQCIHRLLAAASRAWETATLPLLLLAIMP